MKALFFFVFFIAVLHASDEFLPENSEVLELPSNYFLSSPELLGSSLPCTICRKAMSFAVGKIAKKGCSLITRAAMAAACEAAGVGPEDPLADACAVALFAACGEIAKLIADHVTHPGKLCHKANICRKLI